MLDLEELPSHIPPEEERLEGFEYLDQVVDVKTEDKFKQFLIPYIEDILKDEKICKKLGIKQRI